MIEVIHGKLENYSKVRLTENFIFTETERDTVDGVAPLASLVGMPGQAASTESSSRDIAEDADRVKFTLDGKPVWGWLWFSPFNEGDDVSAVVEKVNGKYVAYAVLRPRDRLIALYPHCSRGKLAHWRAVFRELLKWGTALLILMLVVFAVLGAFTADSFADWLDDMRQTLKISLYVCVPLLLVTTVILGFKLMKFVRMAETIFSELGWPAVSRIDLIARSKARPLDSSISFLEKDVDRLDEAFLQTIAPEKAEQLRQFQTTKINDAERMRMLYGAGFFRY
jgi:hypothetical protein